MIAARRARHVAHHYAELGGRSPLIENTMRQAAALEARLRQTLDARVVVAMRYWRPFTAEAIAQLEHDRPGELVLLPLYPQYSRTTSGSSFHEWARSFHPHGWNPRVHTVEEFHQDERYLEAVRQSIDRTLAGFPDPRDVDFVFSAHSVPVAVIERGDPYRRQIERTVELVWERGGWPGRRHLCYQSKVGASKWLRPSMHETIRRLAAERRRDILVAPISFVSDHIETLHEIEIEHRRQAMALGIERFRMVPGLNDSPAFIDALAALVQARVAGLAHAAARPGCA
jgi:protoporphyrin/coproporphyrin ferrochelatase